MDKRSEVFFDMYRPKYPKFIVDMEKKALRDEVPIMRRGTRDWLRFIINTQKPHKILEIGCAVGYSALVMNEISKGNAEITTIEKVPMRIEEAKKNFEKYDKDGNITLIEGDAIDVLKGLSDEQKSYDLIFLDAAKAQYLSYLEYIVKMMNKGAYLITDNILHDGDILESRFMVCRRDRTIHMRMREFIEVVTAHEELETISVDMADGMLISVKK